MLRQRSFSLLLLSVLLSSCASVNFDAPKITSYGIENTGDTYLGQQLSSELQQHPAGESGFTPLSDGIEALAVRLVMAERAEVSIDAQYYLLKDGVVGSAFIDALLKAADRGVRVRLLLDDMFTGGYDAGIVGLNSHPNFEIRIFNPFANRSMRVIDGLTNFSRINRRMHNKSFTADNQMTLIGGRNIADEYFGAREDAKFDDLDVVAIGPVVDEITDMFDSYWNHERAAPVTAFADMPADPAAELIRVRAELVVAREEILNTAYADAVIEDVLKYVESDAGSFVWAPYTLAVDSPDKSIKSEAAEAASITTPLIESLLSAEQEVIVVSPYFVPLRSGIEAFSELQARGVDVTIITNSLAANNQLTVHSGYAPARKPLLRAGVKIYETRDDAAVAGSEIVAASGAKATLHTKAFIVDRKEVFIGSFNFDPRSTNINTELGVIIESPEMSRELAESVDAALPERTYEVFLTEDDQMLWRTYKDGEEIILDQEPDATWSERLLATLFRILPIRGQL